MSYSRVIREGLYTAPTFNLGGDCIQVWGSDGGTLIQDCIFDLSAVPLADQDEAIDCIKGAHVVIDRCVFIGCKKAILGGNGDYPAEDKSGLLFLKNCAFIRCGRRCPEVQDGVIADMSQCWVHDWGVGCFDVRTFGAWAHHSACLTATNCVFSRSHSLSRKDWIVDHLNHLGEAYNDGGIRDIFSRPSWVSGQRRGIDFTGYGAGGSSGCRFVNCLQIGGGQESEGNPSLEWLRDLPDTSHTSLGMALWEYVKKELSLE
nr:MAG TPA: Pectate lyase [Caudoviricetes sp.]